MWSGGNSVKNLSANAGNLRLWFDPWVGMIPWRRARQPTSVFLPGESHGQGSLAGYMSVHRVTKSWPQLKQLSTQEHQLCCCSSVTQLCPTLWDPKDCNTPGLPVPHHLPEFAQVHVHCISDATQPPHPLMPSSSAVDFFQHQGLLQWVSCLHQVTKILGFSFIDPSNKLLGLDFL